MCTVKQHEYYIAGLHKELSVLCTASSTDSACQHFFLCFDKGAFLTSQHASSLTELDVRLLLYMVISKYC